MTSQPIASCARLGASVRPLVRAEFESFISVAALSGPRWRPAGRRSTAKPPARHLIRQRQSEHPPHSRHSDAAKADKPGTKAVVPFEMLPTNHMLVEARINDKGPFRLIFDLGAPITLLNNRASEAAGVVKPDAPRSFLFGMRGEAEVAKLKVGELTAEKLPVIILDHPVLGARGRNRAPHRRHHGIHVLRPLQDDDRLPRPPDDLRADLVSGARPAQGPAGAIDWAPRLPSAGSWRLPDYGECAWGSPLTGPTARGWRSRRCWTVPQPAVAGLKAGDVLGTIDGRWITSIADVYHAAAKAAPGAVVTVVITRDGKELTLTIKPADGI